MIYSKEMRKVEVERIFVLQRSVVLYLLLKTFVLQLLLHEGDLE